MITVNELTTRWVGYLLSEHYKWSSAKYYDGQSDEVLEI